MDRISNFSATGVFADLEKWRMTEFYAGFTECAEEGSKSLPSKHR
jgi:hypothetical protein